MKIPNVNSKEVCKFYCLLKRKTRRSMIVGQEWLNIQTHPNDSIKKPNELEMDVPDPPEIIDWRVLDRIKGSLIGLATGDTLGAHVEYQSRQYLLDNPVTDMQGGGKWSLNKGEVRYHFI